MAEKAKLMKVWEWLEKKAGSHTIFSEPAKSKEFEKLTGKTAGWPTQEIAEINKTANQFKGVTSVIKHKPKERCSCGWIIAGWLETKYAGTSHGCEYSGRGFRFDASLDALKKKDV